MKKLIAGLAAVLLLVGAGCSNTADTVSYNLSRSADEFEVNRRIVFFNGITDTYLMSIEGLCSLGNDSTSYQLSVTCRTGPATYKKHFLGLSDNVSYFVEQVEPNAVDPNHYKVIFKPAAIIPDIELK